MNRQEAAALEVSRRHAAAADLQAEQASQDRARLEAALRHATIEQHAELNQATEAATAEAFRLRQRHEAQKEEPRRFSWSGAGFFAIRRVSHVPCDPFDLHVLQAFPLSYDPSDISQVSVVLSLSCGYESYKGPGSMGTVFGIRYHCIYRDCLREGHHEGRCRRSC